MCRYMMTASLVGFYSAPLIKRFLPVPHKTSMLKVPGDNIYMWKMFTIQILKKIITLIKERINYTFQDICWINP